MKINILSRILDKKINALNVLVELTMRDYVSLVDGIIDQNEMQRRRIRSSKTVYSLLRNDLKEGCTIPPIFLAVKKDVLGNDISLKEIEELPDETIQTFIKTGQVIIL